MSEESPLQGPDLMNEGVPAGDLAEGRALLGHAGGEAVLLVRRAGRVHALGATCTHYGGPLAEGLFDGDAVRCPWHHACFDVETGRAVRGPALAAVPVYRVEEKGGRLRVLGPREVVAAPEPIAAPPASVVIVGSGAAGAVAAETLREEGYAGKVTLVGGEPELPYDRPNLSKDYLAGKAPEEWIPLRSREFYRRHDIELLFGQPVVDIDTEGHRILLGDGGYLPYGALLLATGSEPRPLEVPGADRPHVHTLRSLADSRAIIATAEKARKAVVVGASFIGMEVAAALRERGVEVAVVAPGGRPFERVLGPELGDFLRTLHEEHGVVFHLGETVAAIGETRVTLGKGGALPADLVVVGIGVQPRLELAEKAGLALDRGVVVDRYLQSSDPGIWAAGDIARWPDPHSGEHLRIEHWAVAERQGAAAARNILGRRRPFDAVPFFWTQHYDVPVNYVGHAASWDRIDVRGSVADRDCLLAYRKAGKTLAVASIYRDADSLAAELALERDDDEALRELVPPAG